MRVDAIMTKTVETVRDDATIAHAIDKLVTHRVSGLPVVNEFGKLVGMITEGDLLRRVELGTEHAIPEWTGFIRGREKAARDAAQVYVRDHTRRVADVMTPHPVFVHESASLAEVVALMERHGVRRIPVLTLGGLVGIVSRSDLVRHLGDLMRGSAMLRRHDDAIRADVLAELNHQPWFKSCHVTVTVQGGTVRYAGMIQEKTIEAALRVAAETVPGVIAVRLPRGS